MHRTHRAHPAVSHAATAFALVLCAAIGVSCGDNADVGQGASAPHLDGAGNGSAPTDAHERSSAAPVRTVVLVTIDTLRADFLSAYGGTHVATPAFDALAARGALFERAIAAASSTIPSHATMMTGLPPRRHSTGARNGDTRLDGATTIAQRFQDAGWKTAAFVSNAVLQRRSGLALGFSHYDQDLPEREQLRLTFERRAPTTVEAALYWLRKQRDQPVFLWVHLQDPHGPYTPPAEWLERVPTNESVIETEIQLEAKTWDNPERGIPAYQALEGLDRPSQYIRRYAAEIAYTDAALGRLLEGIAPRGEAAIVVTSDHGESLGEADRWFQHGHASTIDLARVPLAVTGPGVLPQRRLELAGHVDIAPTLLAFAGLQPLAVPSFGLSLVGPLQKQTALPDRTLFCDSAGEASAYRVDAQVRAGGFGTQTAAQAIEALEAGDVSAVRFSGNAASAAGGWEARVDRELADELRSYLRDEVPVVPATPNPETLQRLRALGYLGKPEAASEGPSEVNGESGP